MLLVFICLILGQVSLLSKPSVHLTLATKVSTSTRTKHGFFSANTAKKTGTKHGTASEDIHSGGNLEQTCKSNQIKNASLVLKHNRKLLLRLQLSQHYEEIIQKRTLFNFYLQKIHQKDIQNWKKHHSMRKPAGIPKLLKLQYESSPEGTLGDLMLPAGKQLSWWNRSWYGLQSRQL